MAKNRERENYEEIRQIEDSFKVTTYLDHVYDKITTGKPIPKNMVPNLGVPQLEDHHIDWNNALGQAAGSMNTEQLERAMQDQQQYGDNVFGEEQSPPLTLSPNNKSTIKTASIENRFKISNNQFLALQRFPALVELLGTDMGDELASTLAIKVNKMVVERIAENSKNICQFAHSCIVDKHNIKHGFVGENEEWACMVTASGPFRGDEAFYFDTEVNKPYILRTKGERYEDVTGEFNVIFDFAEKDSC